MYDSLDWYKYSYINMYRNINPTYYHVYESVILLVCYMIHRNYPKEFNITQEILWGAILDWCFNNHLQYQMLTKTTSGDGCMLGLLHYNAVNDCIRALGFVFVLWYLTNKSGDYFPLPFTWIFRDLSKFIFEQTCINVYREYLVKKEPDELGHLDRIIRIYLQTGRTSNGRDSQQPAPRESVGTYLLPATETKAKNELVDSLNKLRPSFSRFKKTVAFRALYRRVKEFEEISQKIYM
jgi:hypothetical protein